MKHIILSPLVLLLTLTVAFGQDLQSISKELKNIQTVKYSVDQQINVVSGSLVDFQLDLIGRGGSHNATVYRVDLIDIDPYRLQMDISRGLMKLRLFTKGNERLITEIKDGEIKRFINDFEVDAEDNDNVETLIEVLKKAIKAAEKKEEARPGYTSLNTALTALCSIVKDIPKPNGKQQQLEQKNDGKVKLTYTLNSGGKNQLTYEVNLSNLNVNGAKLKASGDDVFIEVRTKMDERVIKLSENGLTKSFEYYVRIYASSIENAKEIRRLLKFAGELNKK